MEQVGCQHRIDWQQPLPFGVLGTICPVVTTLEHQNLDFCPQVMVHWDLILMAYVIDSQQRKGSPDPEREGHGHPAPHKDPECALPGPRAPEEVSGHPQDHQRSRAGNDNRRDPDVPVRGGDGGDEGHGGPDDEGQHGRHPGHPRVGEVVHVDAELVPRVRSDCAVQVRHQSRSDLLRQL